MCRFRPSIFFPASYPRLALPTVTGGLDRLGVDDRGGRGRAAPGQDAYGLAQLIVQAPGRAAGLPGADVVVDGAPVRQVGGQRPPHRPVVGQVADRIHDVAPAVGARRAALAQGPARCRQQWLDDRLLGVAHVRGVAAGPAAAADPSRAAPARHSAVSLRRLQRGCGRGRNKVQRHGGSWALHSRALTPVQIPGASLLITKARRAERRRSETVTNQTQPGVVKQALSSPAASSSTVQPQNTPTPGHADSSAPAWGWSLMISIAAACCQRRAGSMIYRLRSAYAQHEAPGRRQSDGG